MIRRIVFIPMSAACFLGAYVAYNVGKIPGFDPEACNVAAVGLGVAGTGSAWLGLKPGKKRRCIECGSIYK